MHHGLNSYVDGSPLYHRSFVFQDLCLYANVSSNNGNACLPMTVCARKLCHKRHCESPYTNTCLTPPILLCIRVLWKKPRSASEIWCQIFDTKVDVIGRWKKISRCLAIQYFSWFTYIKDLLMKLKPARNELCTAQYSIWYLSTSQAPVAQLDRNWSRKPEIPGSIPGRAFFLFYLFFFFFYYLPTVKQL